MLNDLLLTNLKQTQIVIFFSSKINKISNLLLLKLIISDQALITVKWFLPKYVQLNGQKFSGLSEKLLSIQSLFSKKCTKCFFEEKWFWVKFYIKFKCS